MRWRGLLDVIIVFGLLCFLCTVARCTDRCNDYRTDVRIEHFKYFGVNYPWWYGLGQLKQESRCRESARAFDGGMGIAQFMPVTAAAIAKQLGQPVNAFVAGDAIRMQAFFMYQLDKSNSSGYLRYTYQAYNGGWGNLLKEHRRAASWEPFKMRAACTRKTITLKSGIPLSFCNVNYDYPVQIAHYADAFRVGPDRRRY